jgi:hypothetical protein
MSDEDGKPSLPGSKFRPAGARKSVSKSERVTLRDVIEYAVVPSVIVIPPSLLGTFAVMHLKILPGNLLNSLGLFTDFDQRAVVFLLSFFLIFFLWLIPCGLAYRYYKRLFPRPPRSGGG